MDNEPQPRFLVPIVVGTRMIGLVGWALWEWIVRSDYTPSGSHGQQQFTCDGIPPPDRLLQLSPDEEVVRILDCHNDSTSLNAGSTQVGVQHLIELPDPSGVAELLQAEDSRGGGSCNAMLVVVPDLVVTLADGSGSGPAHRTTSATSGRRCWPR